MTIKEALELANQSLDNIEAKVLLKHILKEDNSYIIANSNKNISNECEQELLNSLNKINDGYPLQYITHHQEFMGLNFEVNENVLIPQPDTEVLVENAIKFVLDYNKNNNLKESHKTEQDATLKILDLCTGSGAIAISLKKYLPNVQVFASDISEEALEVAKINSKKNDVQIEFIKSNMFENIKEKFDIIVSNPPYIKSNEILKLSKQVQNEPKLALDGGKDGLDFYRIIAKEVTDYLNNGGAVFLEIGFDQGQAVAEMFKNSKLIKDYAGNDRVMVWLTK